MTTVGPTPHDLLFVGTLPPHPGGSAISAGQILAGLARQGHRIRAVAPITVTALRGGDRFAARHPELHVTRFRVPHFDTTPNIPSTDAYRDEEGAQIRTLLRTLIGERRPDIVFIGRETYVWHVPDVAHAYDLPCVLRLPGVTSYGVLSGTYPETLAARLLDHCRKPDLLISPGRHLAERLETLGLGPITVIPTAVDLQQFSPRPKPAHLLHRLAIAPDDIVVAHLANMKALKRSLDVAESATHALARDPRLVYVMVGDGPLRSRLEDACRAAGTHERFRFVGWQDYEVIPDYVGLADLVVVPSEYEGLARVYIEAQAGGRVLIASDIAPAREVIDDGETGLLFALGDVLGLAAKTLLASGDAALRARIGRQAQVRATAHGLDGAADAYRMALDGVVERHRNRGSARPRPGGSG